MWKWGDRRVQTLSQRRKREREHSWHTYTDSYRWGYKSSLPLRSTNFAKKSTSYRVKGRAYARLFLRENPRLFGQRLSGPPYLLYCKLPLVNPVLAYVYRWLLCLTHKVDIRKFLVLRITPSPGRVFAGSSQTKRSPSGREDADKTPIAGCPLLRHKL